MHNALLAEVERVGGCPRGDMSFEAWSMSPQVKWATFAVVNAMIDAVLPDTVIKSIGIYTEMYTVGFGETLEFEVQPNSLFAVSRLALIVATASEALLSSALASFSFLLN